MDKVCLWCNLILADLNFNEYDLSVCLRPLVTLTSTCNLWQRRNEAAIIWLINTDFPTDGIYLQTRPCFWEWLWFYWWDKKYTLMVGDFRDCYEKIIPFLAFFFFSFIFSLIESYIFMCFPFLEYRLFQLFLFTVCSSLSCLIFSSPGLQLLLLSFLCFHRD